MKRKSVKGAVLVLMASGTLFQFGCLNDIFRVTLQALPGSLLANVITANQ